MKNQGNESLIKTVKNVRLAIMICAAAIALSVQFSSYGATATIYNASWSNPVDQDGDGYKRSATLNWDPDVVGTGSLTVFEKLYYTTRGLDCYVCFGE